MNKVSGAISILDDAWHLYYELVCRKVKRLLGKNSKRCSILKVIVETCIMENFKNKHAFLYT